jgi:uncharacterized membrane protein YdjX (TVP38/TMEM64 family)
MKKIKILWYSLTFIPILLIVLGYIFPSSFFQNQETIRNFVQQFGILAPIVFILLQITQVIITPFSHYAVSLAGGFIFGTWYGFLYNWIGRIIGTAIAFFLGRYFGRKIIKKLVKPETIKKYDNLFDRGKFVLFLMYFLPLFPDDELSYLAGFSSIKAKIFLPLMIFGHIGGSLGLAVLGSGLSYKHPIFIIGSIVTLICGVLFVIYYRKIKPSNTPKDKF